MILPFEKYLKKHKYTSFDLKAVLFDMDGVLFDSMKWHAKSWKQTMDDYNISSEESEFYLYEGMVGFNTIRLVYEREFGEKPSDEKVKEIYKAKTDLFGKLNDKSLIPYALDFVKKVGAKDLLCTLVTGSGQHSLLESMQEKFGSYFTKDRMVTAYDVKFGKPHPEPYLMGLKKSGNLKPNQAIVIENAPRGVEAAVAAGIFTIAINTGPLDPKVLEDAGANIVLPSMKVLFEQFDEYFNQMKTLRVSI